MHIMTTGLSEESAWAMPVFLKPKCPFEENYLWLSARVCNYSASPGTCSNQPAVFALHPFPISANLHRNVTFRGGIVASNSAEKGGNSTLPFRNHAWLAATLLFPVSFSVLVVLASSRSRLTSPPAASVKLSRKAMKHLPKSIAVWSNIETGLESDGVGECLRLVDPVIMMGKPQKPIIFQIFI